MTRAFDSEWYESVAGMSSAPELIACRPIAPLPRQEEIVRDLVQQVLDAGVPLPARVRIVWRDGRPDIVRGAASRHEDGSMEIYVDANLFPDELPRVLFHELMHLSDYHTGMYRELTPGEMEERADRFAGQMLNGEDLDADLLAPSPSTSTSTARAPSTLKPKSIEPSPCQARARYLGDEIARRLERVFRRLSGADARAVRAVLGPLKELREMAAQKDADGG